MPLMALSPALAPQLGVALLNLSGWQSIFVVLAVLSAILVLTTLKQIDTHTKKKATSMGKDIKSLMGSQIYLGNVMMFAMASAAFFAYLTGMLETWLNWVTTRKILASALFLKLSRLWWVDI
jgi:predicted MFS family arabinose efflux permease